MPMVLSHGGQDGGVASHIPAHGVDVAVLRPPRQQPAPRLLIVVREPVVGEVEEKDCGAVEALNFAAVPDAALRKVKFYPLWWSPPSVCF